MPFPVDTQKNSSGGSFRVIHPYVPQHDGEIELCAEDCITNAKDLSNGWTVGRNRSNQAVGIFPSACVVEEALLSQPDYTIDDTSWYGINPDALDRLSTISTDDTCGNSDSQINALGPGDASPPPPDSTENTPHITDSTIPDYPKIYALSYNLNKGVPPKKPQLLVKPSPSQTDTPLKLRSSTMPHQQAQSLVWCQQRQPHMTQRINSQDMLNADIPVYVPPRSSTPAPSRHNSQSNLLRSTKPSVDATSMDSTEQQNVTNETLNNNNSGSSATTMINHTGIPPEQLADIKGGLYYEDYRTLQCPSLDEDETDNIRSTPIQPPPTQPQKYQYKPIMKKQKRNQNYLVDPTTGRGGSPGIYYADTEVCGSERDLDDDRPRSLRLVISVLCGLLSGFILFLWMYHALRYSFLASLISGTSLVALASVAFTASRLCRCMGAIFLPSLCTTRGRITFLVLISGFLLDGAVTNVYQNMEEVSRSMACSTEQSYNQSMLLLQPFDAMMLQLNITVERLQKASADIGHSLRPLSDGLKVMEMNLDTGKMELSDTAKV